MSFEVDIDGIVGGAWHFVNNAKSLRKMSGINYSVDYGQGVIDGCSVSNNGECGLYFRLPTTSCFASARFLNTIVWNHPDGGYLADLSNGDSDASPTFLVPLGHCTFAGNGGSSAYSLEIIEDDRGNGDKGVYAWSGPGGSLTTKYYNTIFERQDSADDDFRSDMISGSNSFLVDNPNGATIATDKIGVAGIRYQDGGATPIFNTSIYAATPIAGFTAWSSTDATDFYLSATTGGFGQTPTVFPLVGSESAFDHEGDLRPVASGGTRDKGADEL